MKRLSHEDIAKIAHQANKAHCENLGDDSQLNWEDAPEWQKSSCIEGVRLHIATLDAGDKPTGESAHEAWRRHKLKDGWRYGPTKDADAKTHPCLVDYDELPLAQRLKDDLFIAVVKVFHGLI